MDEVECVVVGAGVVGLACARALARAGREVVVLEPEGLIGSHTSSRNSEVIHAGIYYPRGSAKARLCVRGRALLYAYCASRGVPHRRLGKIIVATEAEQAAALAGDRRGGPRQRGRGPRAARRRRRSRRLEPALRGVAGLISPSTGIVDSHALMLSLPGRGRGPGRDARLRTRGSSRRGRRRRASRSRSRAAARRRGSRPASSSTPPGSSPGEVAAGVEGLAPPHRREVYFCKGSYFGRGRGGPSRG